jgi:hypothetical protein
MLEKVIITPAYPVRTKMRSSRWAHGVMNKERKVCARRRDGEAAGFHSI